MASQAAASGRCPMLLGEWITLERCAGAAVAAATHRRAGFATTAIADRNRASVELGGKGGQHRGEAADDERATSRGSACLFMSLGVPQQS